STSIRPASGVRSPRSERIIVVFPAPFGPTSPTTVPRGTVNETSSTSKVGRVIRRFEIRTMSSVISLIPPCLVKASVNLVDIDPGVPRGHAEFAYGLIEALGQLSRSDGGVDVPYDETSPV